MPNPKNTSANIDEQISKINANIKRLTEIKEKMSKAILFKSLNTKIESGRKESDTIFVSDLLKKDSSSKEKKPLTDDVQKVERALALQYQEINLISQMSVLKEDWEFLQSRLEKSSAVFELYFNDTTIEEGNILELNNKAIENNFKILEDPNTSVPEKIEMAKQIEDIFVTLKNSIVSAEKGLHKSLASRIKKNNDKVIPEKIDIFRSFANLFRSFLRQINIYEIITGEKIWKDDEYDLEKDNALILPAGFSQKSEIPNALKDKPITNSYIEGLESHTEALREIEEQQMYKIGKIEAYMEYLQEKEGEIRPKYEVVSSHNSSLMKQLFEISEQAQKNLEIYGETLRQNLAEGPKLRFLGLLNNLNEQYAKLDEFITKNKNDENDDDVEDLIKFQTTIDQLMLKNTDTFYKEILSPAEYTEFLKDPNGYECIRLDADGEEVRVKPEIVYLDALEEKTTPGMGDEAKAIVLETIQKMRDGSTKFSREFKKHTGEIESTRKAAESEVKRYEENKEEYDIAGAQYAHYTFFRSTKTAETTPTAKSAPTPELKTSPSSENKNPEEPEEKEEPTSDSGSFGP